MLKTKAVRLMKKNILSDDYLIRKIMAILLETYASIANKRFFCRALRGESFYNLAINSDMSLSCNCNDKYGQGKIGDLKDQSLKEALSGNKAKEFISLLSEGKLPVINCSFCSDLCLTSKEQVERYLQDFKMPFGIMIENTVCCNLNCVSCNREQINSLRKKKNLSLEDIKRISKEIQANDIKSIGYFNLGEPFLSKSIKKELEILRGYNPKAYIIISTNGTPITNNEKRKAALLADEIIFSIAGAGQESLRKYQKKGDFYKSYSNMAELVKFKRRNKKIRPQIKWKYLLFNWNDSKKLVLNAIDLAKKAGIDEIFFERTLSPPKGISYKYYLRLGHLNKISHFESKMFRIKLKPIED